MPQAHDFALGGPRTHFEAFGQRRAFHEKGVVATRLEWRAKICKNAPAIMQDRGGLSVHEPPCANDAAAIRLPNRLVAEAHAEDGQAFTELGNDRKRYPRLVRGARARRKKD